MVRGRVRLDDRVKIYSTSSRSFTRDVVSGQEPVGETFHYPESFSPSGDGFNVTDVRHSDGSDVVGELPDSFPRADRMGEGYWERLTV